MIHPVKPTPAPVHMPITRISPKRPWFKTGVNIYKKVYDKTDVKLREHIKQLSLKTYGQESKDLQVEAVINLVNGRDTFLLL